MNNEIARSFGRLTLQEESELLGFNSQSEAKRWRMLEEEFGGLGTKIFSFEVEKNLRYKDEFLEDKPYSFANLHWFSRETAKLYTQINNHPAFKIEASITKEERDGLTRFGYKRLQEEISRSPETVAVWYSPADPTGGEKRLFDSGRLYLSWCFGNSLNVTFDLKVLEEEFPILGLLNRLSGQEADDEFFYLTHPFNTGFSPEDFFEALEKDFLSNKTVYISHRLAEDPQPERAYTLADLIAGVKKELNDEFFHYQIRKLEEFKERLRDHDRQQPLVYEPIGDQTTDLLMKTEEVRAGYWAVISPHLQDGKVFLYGCSASGLRILDDPFSSAFKTPHIISNFSSDYREILNKQTTKELSKQKTIVVCPKCKHKVFFDSQKAIDEGRLECPHCHNQVNNRCDVEAIIAGAKNY